MNLFDAHKEQLKLKQPVRLFEAFAGIGTQAMALKRLGVEIEHVGISEIDKYAITSYKAIHGDVKNYGNIMDIQGSDLPQIDIFTWSFPCTDLSKAGKQKGLNGTRSGLGYQVLRIVSEMEHKPKVLLMENVPDLLSPKFREGWQEIYHDIEKLGYSNYVETLNAKNYGVAQNRDRVFMVSILGEYSYEFPKWVTLEKRLKDYLEPVVDEKYYMNDKMLKYFTGTSNGWERQFRPLDEESEHSHTITAREGNVAESTYITIPEATKQGYALAKDGDGVYLNRPHQKRGVVQKGMIQTIKTSGDDIGVVIGSKQKNAYIGTTEEPSPTLTSAMGMGGGHVPMIANSLRIRKLTPLECWRLMGISDDDYEKASKVCSNSQLYKQAGNAIVVDVLMAIFGEML